MSDLSNHYQQIIKDLQEKIQNEEEKVFVINKFQELSMMFMDIIDRLTALTDIRVKEIESDQRELNNKLTKLQKSVDGIENDIYEDDDTYEFEITCPYCNHEFVTDINSDANTEVECPECHNIIELDWNNEEDQCEHECSHCAGSCVAEEEEEYNKEEKKTKKKKQDESEKNENEDDDM